MRMYAKRRALFGFTLVEVLVAVALFALFTLTLTQILIGGMRTFRRGNTISELRSDLKNALDLMASEFRAVNGVDQVFSPQVSASYSKVLNLSFNRTSQTTNNATSISTITVNYVINSTSNTLVRQVAGSNDVLIAENILVGSTLGDSSLDNTNPRSYFCWVTSVGVGEDKDAPNNVLEMRLTGMKYVGTEEQKLTVTTQVAVRSGDSSGGDAIAADNVPLIQAADLSEPLHIIHRKF